MLVKLDHLARMPGIVSSQQPPFSEPSSPCTGVCRLNRASSQCLGCLRTIDEIVAWPTLSVARKRALLAALALRTIDDAGDTIVTHR